MKTILLCALVLGGCALFPESQKVGTPPELVYHTPLPQVPPQWTDANSKMEVLFHVDKTGKVIEARIMTPTGNEEWDSRALEEMKQWQFSPARTDGETVPMWIRLPIRIQFSEPKILMLEGLLSTSRALADSAYVLLSGGDDIAVVMEKLGSVAPELKHEVFGQVDIRRYAKEIQRQLLRLGPNEYTTPVRLGEVFVIFRRLPENHTSNMR